MEIPSDTPSFYKRPLPSTCTSFISEEGKAIFGRALQEGNLNSYFPLASQVSLTSSCMNIDYWK